MNGIFVILLLQDVIDELQLEFPGKTISYKRYMHQIGFQFMHEFFIDDIKCTISSTQINDLEFCKYQYEDETDINIVNEIVYAIKDEVLKQINKE